MHGYAVMKNNPLDSYIGQRLKKQRQKLGVSQSKLASLLKCSHQLVQKQEAGEARIPAANLFDIASILGVDTNYFFEGYVSSEDSELCLPEVGDTIRHRTKHNWNILLVEDDPQDEILMRKALELPDSDAHIAVECCYNGVAVLQYLRDIIKNAGKLPDFIFLDLNIPKKNGFDVLKELKQDRTLRFIPVIVLTNSVNASEMLKCYEMQASGYVCKSFDVHQFNGKIHSTLIYWMDVVATPQNY